MDGMSGRIWKMAAAVGVVAFIVLKWLAHYGVVPALVLAILVACLVALVLWVLWDKAPAVEDRSAARTLASGTRHALRRLRRSRCRATHGPRRDAIVGVGLRGLGVSSLGAGLFGPGVVRAAAVGSGLLRVGAAAVADPVPGVVGDCAPGRC